MTTLLLVVNIAMFVVEVAYGGVSSLWSGPPAQRLYDLGALYPPAIAQGHQYWRLFTSMFLHEGLWHIGFNMYALYLFGYLVEGAFGSRRFLAIYFVSGFLASVTSFAFGPVVELAVGASGAIVGVFGAWIAFNYRRRSNPLAAANLQWALTLLALNALLPFIIHGIDWRAHVGGLISGVIVGWFMEGVGPRALQPVIRVAGTVALLAIGVALTMARVAALT
jgi:rhomboid protease GluP